MTRRVAVVTDSTANLPEELVARYGIRVVPLRVAIGGPAGSDGTEVSTQEIARALGERRITVTTSRPAPAEFTAAYREVLEAGAEAVVSVHLSAELSGTCEAAAFAADNTDDPVTVVDSRSTAMGLGFVVLAAAEAAGAGGDLAAVTAAARQTIDRTTTLFYVDTLEHLRRGGRIGAAAALLGTALSVKPILYVKDGAVVVREKVRTTGRALARLQELAVEAAGDDGCDLAVQHLASPERAAELQKELLARIPKVGHVVASEVGAVVGAHTGPGVLGVVVSRHG
jgi:DegV family protein with EDD domain